jgi:hypothetical protein
MINMVYIHASPRKWIQTTWVEGVAKTCLDLFAVPLATSQDGNKKVKAGSGSALEARAHGA